MTTITLPPEVEASLAEAARKKGTTPESLAVESLRQLFVPAGPTSEPPTAKTLYDHLDGFIGKFDGTGEAFSENCGKRFADALAEKHKAAGS